MSKLVWDDSYSEAQEVLNEYEERINRAPVIKQASDNSPVPAYSLSQNEQEQTGFNNAKANQSLSDPDPYDWEDIDEDQEDDQIVLNARMRLEQGRLYEMLLNHRLFEGVSAHPKVVASVEREIKRFVKSRLEVLLGLKPDPKLVQQQAEETQATFPFNELEISLLKQVLSKMTKGATSGSPPQQQESGPSLNPIKAKSSGAIKPVSEVKQVSQLPKVKPDTKSVVTPNAPVKKEAKTVQERPELKKSPFEMNASELIEYNKRISEEQRYKKAFVPPEQRLPMPSADALEAHYMVRQSSIMPIVEAIMRNKK